MTSYVTDTSLDVATMIRPDQARLRTPKAGSAAKGLCRWCGGPVAPPRRSWCGGKCVAECNALHPQSLRNAVRRRDNGKCALCGAQGQEVEWEADHTTPLCEGGYNVLSNIRTLCCPCHRAETRALSGRRAIARRAARGSK